METEICHDLSASWRTRKAVVLTQSEFEVLRTRISNTQGQKMDI